MNGLLIEYRQQTTYFTKQPINVEVTSEFDQFEARCPSLQAACYSGRAFFTDVRIALSRRPWMLLRSTKGQQDIYDTGRTRFILILCTDLTLSVRYLSVFDLPLEGA